jgi:hypothetical protein
VLCCLVFNSCKKKEAQNNASKISTKKPINQLNFDALLKCSDYSFQENYYLTADYGCIYNPKDKNSYGNVILYLIPKSNNQTNANLENLKINDLDAKTIKNNFTIYAYLIPKIDLNYNPKGDPIYYQKEKFKEELYTFNSNSNQWILLNSIQINNYSENAKEQSWRENFIDAKANATKSTQQLEYSKGFYTYENISLDLKTKKYKLVVLEKNSEKNNASGTHFNLPVLILEKKGNDYVEIKRNNNLIFEYDDNCPADGYQSTVTKGNYITIQQSNCVDFLFVTSYTTFKIDEVSSEIVLHKYGEEYTDRSNPDKEIPSKTWSTKDFGTIKFENVNSDAILKLRRINPK